MAEQSPWSIKGVDRKTREQMKKIAQETGVTLGELLSGLLAKQAEQNDNVLKKSKETIQKKETAQKRVPSVAEPVKKTAKQSKEKTVKQGNIVALVPQKNNKIQDETVSETSMKKNNIQKQAPIIQDNEEFVENEPNIETPKSVRIISKKSSEPKQKLFIPKEAIKNTLFNDLLKKNTPHVQTSESSQVVHHKMPADVLQDIVFEGRDLRDALRAHTSELTKEIRSQVDASIETRLQEIKTIITDINQTRLAEQQTINLQKSEEESEALEILSQIDASIETRLQEIKTIITDINQTRLAEQDTIAPQKSEEELEALLELRKNAFLNEAKQLVHESLEDHLHSVRQMLASQQEEMFVSQSDNDMNITDLSHKLRSDMRDVMSQIIGQATHHSIEDAEVKKKEFLSEINHLIQNSLKDNWNSFRKILEARQNVAVSAGTQEKFSVTELSHQIREDVCDAVTHIMKQMAVTSVQDNQSSREVFLKEVNSSLENALTKVIPHLQELFGASGEKNTQIHLAQTDIEALSHKLHQDIKQIVLETLKQSTGQDAQSLRQDIKQVVAETLKQSTGQDAQSLCQDIKQIVSETLKQNTGQDTQSLRQDIKQIVSETLKQNTGQDTQSLRQDIETLKQNIGQDSQSLRQDIETLKQNMGKDARFLRQDIKQVVVETLKQNMGKDTEALHQDIKQVVAETLKQGTGQDAESLRQDMQGFMIKIGNSLLESVDEKINTLIDNALLVGTQDNTGQLSLEMATLRELRTNSEVILGRLSHLEEVCHQLDKKIQQNIEKNIDYSELHTMREELKNFIMNMPHRIQEVFEKPNENIKSIALSMHALAERIETVGHLAKKIPEMLVNEPVLKPEPITVMASAKESAKKPQTISQHVPQFQDDEFDTVPEGGEFSEDILADLQNAERDFMTSAKKKPENDSFLKEDNLKSPAKEAHLVREPISVTPQEELKEKFFPWDKAKKPDNGHKELEAFEGKNDEEYEEEYEDDVYDAQFYEDDDEPEQKKDSQKNKNFTPDNNTLQDEWDETDLYEDDDETEEDYLGFTKEENIKKPPKKGGASDKTSLESPDIRAMDRATIMYKTRRSALNEMHKRDKNYDPKLDKTGGIMANFYNANNKRNVMIVGGLALTSLVLIGVLFLL